MDPVRYSVIIPFRDNISILKIACDSIPNREDIQVIIIDNSNVPFGCDVTADFLNPNLLYLTSDPRKGAGCARNEGLKYAKGRWLLFLDSDDYFTDDAFDVLDKYYESDYDIVYFNATSINLKYNKISNRHVTIDNLIKRYLSTGNEDYLRYSYINPVCKIIRRSLIENNNIKFQEVPASNDIMFSVWSGHSASKIIGIDHVIYVITEGEEGSSLTRTKSLINQRSRYYVMIDRVKFLNSINKSHLCPRIISYTLHGFKDFGIIEGTKWVIYSIKNKINPFAFGCF